jgi:hypothetical protein
MQIFDVLTIAERRVRCVNTGCLKDSKLVHRVMKKVSQSLLGPGRSLRNVGADSVIGECVLLWSCVRTDLRAG